MADILVVGILVLLIGLAVLYIVKAKKRGVKCIGCPSCGTCSRNHAACSENGR